MVPVRSGAFLVAASRCEASRGVCIAFAVRPTGTRLQQSAVRANEKNDEEHIRSMAVSAICRVARYSDDAAHVDADCRKDPADSKSVDQSFLARHAISDLTRPHDFADPARFFDI